jgi:hypothetical protein
MQNLWYYEGFHLPECTRHALPIAIARQAGSEHVKNQRNRVSLRGSIPVSVSDFDQDGEFNVWQITQDENIKEITKD